MKIPVSRAGRGRPVSTEGEAVTLLVELMRALSKPGAGLDFKLKSLTAVANIHAAPGSGA